MGPGLVLDRRHHLLINLTSMVIPGVLIHIHNRKDKEDRVRVKAEDRAGNSNSSSMGMEDRI